MLSRDRIRFGFVKKTRIQYKYSDTQQKTKHEYPNAKRIRILGTYVRTSTADWGSSFRGPTVPHLRTIPISLRIHFLRVTTFHYLKVRAGPTRPDTFHVAWSGMYIYMYIHDTYVHELIDSLIWNIKPLWQKERWTTNCTVIYIYINWVVRLLTACSLQFTQPTVYCMQHGPLDPARRRFGRLYFCPPRPTGDTVQTERTETFRTARYGAVRSRPVPVQSRSSPAWQLTSYSNFTQVIRNYAYMHFTYRIGFDHLRRYAEPPTLGRGKLWNCL